MVYWTCDHQPHDEAERSWEDEQLRRRKYMRVCVDEDGTSVDGEVIRGTRTFSGKKKLPACLCVSEIGRAHV